VRPVARTPDGGYRACAMWWRWRSAGYPQALIGREILHRARREGGDDRIMALLGGMLLVAVPLAVLQLLTAAWWVVTGRQPPFLGYGRDAPVSELPKPDSGWLREAVKRAQADAPPGVLMRTPGAARPRPTRGGAG
jgi:hypothetical protein